MNKTCEHCGAIYDRNPHYSDKQWGLSRFCSRRCAAQKTVGVSVLERLFSFVEINETTRCWEWRGSGDNKGYGFFNGERAHRQAYRLAVGSIPDDQMVLHRCDNRRCVNPYHLFLGTAQDNVDDMILKGRAVHLRGEQSPSSRLTTSEVIAIREDSRPQDEIAKDYGIAQTTVSAIKRKVNWGHVS